MLRQFGDDFIAVAVGDDAENFNKLITLNSVGAFIFNFLSEERERGDIVNALMDTYEVDRKTAERDVDAFVDNLRAAGLLDE